MRALILLFLLLLPALAGAQLPAPVAAALKQQKLPTDGLSLWVQEVTAPQPLLTLNADTPRNPASTIKLLTTYAALELLGPAYTWKTAVHLNGPLRAGVLQGDLVLKGYGDPFLTVEYFWKLLYDVRNRGVHDIRGDLIIDNSYFALTHEPAEPFDEEPQRAYNAAPSALMLNFQSVGFHLVPEPGGRGVAVVAEPSLANLTIQNRLRSLGGGCSRREIQLGLTPTADGATAIISGTYPRACGGSSLYRTVMAPERLVYGAFQTFWRELGGQFSGKLRNGQPMVNQPFYELESRPLAELIRGINKFSNNVMTRQLLLALGAQQLGAPGSVAKGQQAVDAWLRQKGLDFPELVLDNGAGLSRSAAISARSLGRLLLSAYVSPFGPELQASLPLAAIDGTVQGRFRGEAVTGRARLKTGTLTGVKSIAGYVLAQSGRTYVVVALHNRAGLDQNAASAVEDALVRWVFSQ